MRQLCATLFVVTGVANCAGNNSPISNVPAARTTASHGISPGDAIRIDIFRESELSKDYVVDERGVVAFPLIGEKVVTGVPPDSLRHALVADFSEYLRDPSIQVTFLRRINILGEVRTPGLYPVDPTISLADALALAGGVGPNGNPNDIRLIRSGRVVQRLSQATLVGQTEVRSGDQIIVGQESWFTRNLPLVTSFIAAVSAITVALILR